MDGLYKHILIIQKYLKSRIIWVTELINKLSIAKNNDGVTINEIKVLSKDDGQVIQVINPQDNKCDFGFYMTPIYQNVERFSSSSISLNCYSTNQDILVEYKFKRNKYLKNN